MATTVLIPLRAPGEGKTRLAGALSAGDRAALTGAMLADVVAAVRDAEVERVVVAAGGATAVTAAAALGVEVVPDPPGVASLDAALAAATSHLGAVAELLVVPADLPRLTAADVRAVLTLDAEVVVAPTGDGGTGGLLRRPGDVLTTSYGPGSAARHERRARAAGLRTLTVARRGFADDVDTLVDLRALAAGPVGPCTAALLPRIGDRLTGTA
jgi:2-phospho-L-lactate guanylyltransferase